AGHRSGQSLPELGDSGAALGCARRLEPCRASNYAQAPLRAFSAYPDAGWAEAVERSAWGRTPTFRGAGYTIFLKAQRPRDGRKEGRIVRGKLCQVGGFPSRGRDAA